MVRSNTRKSANLLKYHLEPRGSSTREMARCLLCQKCLMNTSIKRLVAHRKKCGSQYLIESTVVNGEPNLLKYIVTDDGGVIVKTFKEEQSQDPLSKEIDIESDTNEKMSSSDSSEFEMSFCKNLTETLNQKRRKIQSESPIEMLTEQEKSNQSSLNDSTLSPSITQKLCSTKECQINSFLLDFFVGCNVSFNAIESEHFKNLIESLNETYSSKLPTYKQLTTTLLDNSYTSLKTNMNQLKNSNLGGILLLDTWKNLLQIESSTEITVAILKTTKGNQYFVNAWPAFDVSDEKYAEHVIESINLVAKEYKQSIYGIVSSSPSQLAEELVKQICEPLVSINGVHSVGLNKIWHCSCNKSICTKFLSECIQTIQKITKQIWTIMKKFKNYEEKIIALGGNEIKITDPLNKNPLDIFQMYSSFYYNIKYLNKFNNSSSLSAEIWHKDEKNRVVIESHLKNTNFTNTIWKCIQFYKSILQITGDISDTSSSSTVQTTLSAAASIEKWLDVKYNIFDGFKLIFLRYQEMAMNIYAVTAYYLHPQLSNDKLPEKWLNLVHEFLLSHLSGEALEDLHEYQQSTGIFTLLLRKNIKNPIVFWSMAKHKHLDLAEFAIQLLSIPATVTQMPYEFTEWSYVHSRTRNDLTFDKWKQLMKIYYFRRNEDLSCSKEPNVIKNYQPD